MIRYGKTTQQAISAMSRLAEASGSGGRLSSHQVAEQRGLPQPVVAKLLTTLSQHGLVTGAPGPGGGYALAQNADEITLFDIADCFERFDEKSLCPFGPRWCGHGDPCPLHDQLTAIDDRLEAFLRSTTLAVFTKSAANPPAK